MATDLYVNTNQEAGVRSSAGAVFPGKLMVLSGTYEKTASDNDTSVLRLGTVPADAVPVGTLSLLGNDALSGATDIDVGVYSAKDGAVVDKDCLSDGVDIASGAALGSERRAFQALALDEFGQSLRTLAGGAIGDGDDHYDIAITGNTFGTATGTISWVLAFILPQ